MTSISNLSEDLKNTIRVLVKQVVVENHSAPQKQMIKEMSGRLNLACPYCGDSTTDLLKKRGNIFWDTLQYHCYNCNHHSDLTSFFRDHGKRFGSGDDSINVIEYIKEKKVQVQEISTLQHNVYNKAVELAIDVSDFKRHFKAEHISTGDFAWFYLRGRLLHNRADEFLYSAQRKKLWILNKTPDGKILSCQSRQMGKNARTKYLTYDLAKLYEEMGREFPLEGTELIAVNKMSTLFGIMQVDMMRSVTVFEGPLDAKFMFNSIALATAGRSTTELDEIPTIRYMFDNDETGKKKMLEKLRKGKSVFMWSKFLKDTKLNIYNDEIKDLNDLIKKCFELKSDAHKKIGEYFTSSQLDALYV